MSINILGASCFWLAIIFFGLAVLGGLVKLYGIIRHRPDIF